MLQWVYTSEAPTPLVDLFDELAGGPGTNGTLAAAVDQAMGEEPLLYVLCTGQGAGMSRCSPPPLLQRSVARWCLTSGLSFLAMERLPCLPLCSYQSGCRAWPRLCHGMADLEKDLDRGSRACSLVGEHTKAAV